MDEAPAIAPAASAAAILEALNDRDAARLAPLVAAEVELTTVKGTRHGREAFLEWSQNEYDHLLRRFLLDEAVLAGRGVLGRGRAQYVWREGGAVADTTPVYLSFVFGGALLCELGLHDTEEEARAALAAD